MDQNGIINRLVIIFAFTIGLIIFGYHYLIIESDIFIAAIYSVIVMMACAIVFQLTFSSMAKVLMKHLDEVHKRSESESMSDEEIEEELYEDENENSNPEVSGNKEQPVKESKK